MARRANNCMQDPALRLGHCWIMQISLHKMEISGPTTLPSPPLLRFGGQKSLKCIQADAHKRTTAHRCRHTYREGEASSGRQGKMVLAEQQKQLCDDALSEQRWMFRMQLQQIHSKALNPPMLVWCVWAACKIYSVCDLCVRSFSLVSSK